MSERGGAVNIVPPLQQMAEGAKEGEGTNMLHR